MPKTCRERLDGIEECLTELGDTIKELEKVKSLNDPQGVVGMITVTTLIGIAGYLSVIADMLEEGLKLNPTS